MKNIVLIGMMGAGKTTVGKFLAKKLDWFKFVDSDDEIEKKQEKTISEIFAQDGEEAFRICEMEIVDIFSKNKNQIFATGAGVVENEKNIENLKKNGILFYLETNTEILKHRIRNCTTRPLKNDFDNIFKKREKIYKQADFIVSTNLKLPEDVGFEIMKHYSKIKT